MPTVTSYDPACDLIAELLEHPAGFQVGLGGKLVCYRLQDGRFVMVETRNQVDVEQVYAGADGADRAAAAFLKRRTELKLGLDLKAP